MRSGASVWLWLCALSITVTWVNTSAWFRDNSTDLCYMFVNTTKQQDTALNCTYQQAQNRCMEERATLPMLKSNIVELGFLEIVTKIGHELLPRVPLGLKYMASDGWIWTDGTKLNGSIGSGLLENRTYNADTLVVQWDRLSGSYSVNRTDNSTLYATLLCQKSCNESLQISSVTTGPVTVMSFASSSKGGNKSTVLSSNPDHPENVNPTQLELRDQHLDIILGALIGLVNVGVLISIWLCFRTIKARRRFISESTTLRASKSNKSVSIDPSLTSISGSDRAPQQDEREMGMLERDDAPPANIPSTGLVFEEQVLKVQTHSSKLGSRGTKIGSSDTMKGIPNLALITYFEEETAKEILPDEEAVSDPAAEGVSSNTPADANTPENENTPTRER